MAPYRETPGARETPAPSPTAEAMHPCAARLRRRNRKAFGAGNVLAGTGDRDAGRHRGRGSNDRLRFGGDAGPHLDQGLSHLPAAQQRGRRTMRGQNRLSRFEQTARGCEQFNPAAGNLDDCGGILSIISNEQLPQLAESLREFAVPSVLATWILQSMADCQSF